MTQCVVPNWNLKRQKQGQNQGREGNNNNNKSSNMELADSNNHDFLHQQNFTPLIPMTNHELAELTWKNGQLGKNEVGGNFAPPPPPPPTSTCSSTPWKPRWGSCNNNNSGGCETLESIVHQATNCNNNNNNKQVTTAAAANSIINSMPTPTHTHFENNKRKTMPPPPSPSPSPSPSGVVKERRRSDGSNRMSMAYDHESGCNNDITATMMTWTSFESPRSCTRTKTTTDNDEDPGCQDAASEEAERDTTTKGETGRSYTRKGRAAAVHNQSERRRRDRINEKMKTLQKLVPNASKTDKASMLDEVIEYLKQLQAQVQMMSNARFMPQLMMPLGMQQHLHQMSLLARMGMEAGLGMGIGMLNGLTPPQPTVTPQIINPTQVPTTASPFVPPGFVVPPIIPATQQSNSNAYAPQISPNTSQDLYSTMLAQSMNIDLYNKMAALQRQQQTQAQQGSHQMQMNNHVHGG